MHNVASVCERLEAIAPLELAEHWDNVGLLVGDRARPVSRLMTCLTITPESAAEAVEAKAQMIVTHHPLPFRETRRLTSDTTVGRLLLQLIEAGIAIYSPHTALDSAREGINQQIADTLGLGNTQPLVRPHNAVGDDGSGRYGQLPQPITLEQLARMLGEPLGCVDVGIVGSRNRSVQNVGIACGSGGEFLAAAEGLDCDVLVTGETSFHNCLEAEALGMGLVLTGHFSSEVFALRDLAERLEKELEDLEVFASRREVDPIERIHIGQP